MFVTVGNSSYTHYTCINKPSMAGKLHGERLSGTSEINRPNKKLLFKTAVTLDRIGTFSSNRRSREPNFVLTRCFLLQMDAFGLIA